MTHPGVGPITALATEVFLSDPRRFANGKAVATYIGMIPEEKSSGVAANDSENSASRATHSCVSSGGRQRCKLAAERVDRDGRSRFLFDGITAARRGNPLPRQVRKRGKYY